MSVRSNGSTNDLTLAQAFSISGAFWIGFWLRRRAAAGGGANLRLMTLGDAPTSPSTRAQLNLDNTQWFWYMSPSTPTGSGETLATAVTVDTWYYVYMDRDGSNNVQFKVFDDSSSTTPVWSSSGTNSADYSAVDALVFGSSTSDTVDCEYIAAKVCVGVGGLTNTQIRAEADTFAVQVAGGTNYEWELENVDADVNGLYERGGSGPNFTNTGFTAEATRPSTLEAAGGSANAGNGTVPYSYAVSGTGAGQTIGNGTVPYSYAVSGTGAGQTIGNGTVPYSYAVAGTGAGQTIGTGTVPYEYAVAGTGAVGVTSADGVVPYSYAVGGTGFSAGEAPTGAYAAYSQDLQRRLAEWAAKQSPQTEPRKRRKRAAKVAPNPTFDVFVPEAKVAPFPERVGPRTAPPTEESPPRIVVRTGKGRVVGPRSQVRGAGYVNRWSPDDDAAALLLLMNAAAA